MTRNEFYSSASSNFIYPNITKWISADKMSESEKSSLKGWETAGGYSKVFDYKEAWIAAWEKASDQQRNFYKNLPNFDSDIFLEITGIDVREQEKPKVEQSLSGKEAKHKLA